MGARSFHDDIKWSRGISPVSEGGDSALVSQIVDTADFASTEFLILTGSLADSDATFTLLIEDGDVSNLDDNAAVADANLVGTEAAGNGSFTFAEDDIAIKIGYIGPKRYVRATITPANNGSAALLAGGWLQSAARIQQTAQQV